GVDYILKPYAAEEVVARVKIHLQLARRAQASYVEPQTDGPMDEDAVLVRAAQEELRSCLSSNPRLADLAACLGVNERRLSRAFRRVLNTTPFEYLRQERMKKAEWLLAKTSLGVAAIAHEVGFAGAANF